MPDTVHSFAWRFGGPLSGLPPALAWTLLAAAGLLGAAWIIFSYRRTLVTLAPRSRRSLVTLRLLLWAGLLLALAGPTRIERTYAAKTTRPLAVLVDQSASMTTPDNRRQRRSDDALRRWNTLAPAAAASHGTPKSFAFADTPVPMAIAAADAPPALPDGQTRLFHSIDALLAAAPPGGWGGIAVLTDGLDTRSAEPAAALATTARSALAAATPLYLVPGRNRYAGGHFLHFRELALPAVVPPHSSFQLEITLDSYQSTPRDVPLRLKIGDTWRAPETLRLESGRRALVWSVELAAGAPGLIPIELIAGTAPDAARARAEVRIAAPDSTRILYYQGALDWGYRFLADILHRDPAFTLTPVFNLAAADASRRRSSAPGTLAELPESAAGYEAFDVVVLSNVAARQLSSARQAALSTWVRGGGVLLFLAPDDAATRGFAGSELEKMLPVVFAPAAPTPDENPEITAFRRRMRQAGGAHPGMEVSFSRQAARAPRQTPLSVFAWEPRAAALFGAELTESAPRFANYARVVRAKPGADVLARHPRDPGPEGDEHAILLALQRYGRGQSAIMTSDALWRWKLNQPSNQRGVEKFWQNLFAWLARERLHSLRFERPPMQAEVGSELTLRIAGASGPVTVTVTASRELTPQAPAVTLTPAGEDEGARLFRWTPGTAGPWCLSARPGDGEAVRHWLEAVVMPVGEASGSLPDEAVLRSLAERTGGAVLDDTPPPAWLGESSGPRPTLLREATEPLWHHGWIFAALLSSYTLELVLRRRWRLL